MKKFKSIRVFNRGEAERLTKEDVPLNTIMISISSPDIENASLNEEAFVDVLYVSFHDSEDDFGGRFLPIQKYHARKILDFVNKHKAQAENIFVHCQAGQSRSPATAFAIQKIFNGEDTEKPGWKNHSGRVRNMIVDVNRGLGLKDKIKNRYG
jgi:predicted protein tyrosine phosphatase